MESDVEVSIGASLELSSTEETTRLEVTPPLTESEVETTPSLDQSDVDVTPPLTDRDVLFARGIVVEVFDPELLLIELLLCELAILELLPTRIEVLFTDIEAETEAPVVAEGEPVVSVTEVVPLVA